MAGSFGLNKRFELAIMSLVGEDQYKKLRTTKGFKQAMTQFDRSIKTAFRGDPDEDYYVNFPMANLEDDLAKNLESNCWNMKGFACPLISHIYDTKERSREDVSAIFEPVVENIEKLVAEQVRLVKIKREADRHPKANTINVLCRHLL